MVLLYMVTFTINIPPMLAYIPYMDPMGIDLMSFSPIRRVFFFATSPFQFDDDLIYI